MSEEPKGVQLSTTQWVQIARTILIALLALASVLGYDVAVIQPREIVVQEEAITAAVSIQAQHQASADQVTAAGSGVSHFSNVQADTLKASAPTAVGTATPAMIVDSAGVSNIFEVRDAGTPVFSVADGGGTNWPANTLALSAPTAVGTATPGLVVDSAGVSNIFEVRDAATPVFYVSDGGNVSWPSGALAVSAPTAVATATPALVVDSAGVSNIFEVRDAATPVAQVANGGNWTIAGAIAQTGDFSETGDMKVTGSITASTFITAEHLYSYDDAEVVDDLTVGGIISQNYGEENLGVPSVISTAITYTAAAGGTGAVATIGDGEVWLVWSVIVSVTEDWACTGDDCTLVIGDGNDANGFVDLADAELQAADTEYTGAPAGWQGLVAATMGIYLDGAVSSAPHIYAPSGADETIDWLADEGDGETMASGAATIYVVYTRLI